MAVSAIAAAVSTAGSWAAGTLIAGSIATTFAVNFALSAVAKALQPKPPSLDFNPKDNTVTVKSPISSRKMIYGKTRVGGTVVFIDSTGDTNEYLHMVIALAGHEIEALDEVYFDDELVAVGTSVQGDYTDTVRINFHDGSQTTADSDLVDESSNWTDDHKLLDVAYLYIRIKFDQDLYTGIPNISAVVRGKKVYNPDTGVTEYSNNPALCILDYLKDTKYGLGVTDEEINTSSFISAYTLSNQTVDLDAGGVQSRYTLDGVVDTESTPKDIIQQMLTSLAGTLTYSGGEFFLKGGAYTGSSGTITNDDITGPLSIQTRRPRRELFNAVKGVFSSVEDNYILADYPPVISSAYALEDGDPSYLDVGLPYTTDAARAQRLAKLNLLRSRKQITVSLPCNLSAMKYKAGDTIAVTNSRLGWTAKEFEVTGWKFSLDSSGMLGVTIACIETSEAIYDWTTDDETPFVAGQATNLPSTYSVSAPDNLQTVAGALVFTDGTAMSYIDVTWDNNDAFATSFELQYRKGTETFKSVITHNTFYRLENIEAGGDYDIQVRAINRLGARSAFVSGDLIGVSDSTAPSAPTSVSVQGAYRALTIRWTNPADTDFRQVAIYENDSNDSSTASLIGYSAGSEFYRPNLDINVTKWYFLKAIDFTGNESGFTTGVSGTTGGVDSADFEGDVRQLFLDQDLDIIEPVSTLPASGDFTGQQKLLTTDGALYRWNGTAWVLSIADVADNSITGDKIVANTITGGLIAASGIITNSAQINDSLITNAKIANAAVTNAKISGAISSTNYLAGTSGWQIDKAGDAEFNDVIIRGTIEASTLDTDSLTVQTSVNCTAPLSNVQNFNFNGLVNNVTQTSVAYYSPEYSTGYYENRLASTDTPIYVFYAMAGDRDGNVLSKLQVEYDGDGTWTDVATTQNYVNYLGSDSLATTFTPSGTWNYFRLRMRVTCTNNAVIWSASTQMLFINGT